MVPFFIFGILDFSICRCAGKGEKRKKRKLKKGESRGLTLSNAYYSKLSATNHSELGTRNHVLQLLPDSPSYQKKINPYPHRTINRVI